ncbi:hypothetical protein [Rhodoferax sp.]|uniref:hypothetical protein n=1 Tax=Rhodoferax sp. TaxID=50421 RepID=UPI003BB02642
MASSLPSKPSTMTKNLKLIIKAVLPTTALLLCLLVINRYQILNGFSILSGDGYDYVISTTLLEHWFNFFTGQANWSDVLYFYPYGRSIAQTDAYLLVGVAYLPFRWLGFDPFIASEFSGSLIKSVGFVSMLLLTRRKVGLSLYGSVLAATLFTMSNGMTLVSYRLQLATVAFAPLLTHLVWNAIESLLNSEIKNFKIYGVLSGILFGAWCLSCFYMAWFFCFFATVFFILLFFTADTTARTLFYDRVRQNKSAVVLVLISAMASLIPFIWAFLPKSREVGVRSYEMVLSNTIYPENILQTGPDNWLFGPIYLKLLGFLWPGYVQRGAYYNSGFSLPLFILFALACYLIISHWRKHRQDRVFFICVMTTLVTWGLALNLGGKSAWFFVYSLFPGAKALNAVGTFQIFLAFPVVLLAIRYLSRAKLPPVILFLLTALLLVSELNKPYLNFHRQQELDRVALKAKHPDTCRAFYVSGWKGQDTMIPEFPEWINNYYAHNVSAMLIAQRIRLPTVNGIASFNPPDWSFGHPNNPDYDQRVLTYAQRHQVVGLCKLRLNDKTWEVITP